MKSPVVKRSVIIGGHKTSVTLENVFWRAIQEIATIRNMTLSTLIMSIKAQHPGNLSSAIRLFVLEFYRIEATAARRTGAQNPAIRRLTGT